MVNFVRGNRVANPVVFPVGLIILKNAHDHKAIFINQEKFRMFDNDGPLDPVDENPSKGRMIDLVDGKLLSGD